MGETQGATPDGSRRRRPRRTRSPHPGVVLLARTLPSGGTAYRARYVDPRTGRTTYVTLDASLSTAERRTRWAKELAATLAARRAELAANLGEPEPEPEPERPSIDASIAVYLEGAEVRLRERTRDTYQQAIERFRAWCASEAITDTHALDGPALARLRDYLIRLPKLRAAKGKGRGRYRPTPKPRGPVTVNRELRSIGTLLNAWRLRGLVPNLSRDAISDGLAKLPVSRELPRYLTPADLRRLIEAALRHDRDTYRMTRLEHWGDAPAGSTPRHEAIAPFLAALLLTGARLNELVTLRWPDVDLDALDAGGAKVGEIRLRSAEVKTRTARVIGLEVSPRLRRILAALRLHARGEGEVFPAVTLDAAQAARRRLARTYGAPPFRWQDLRSTCATYLVAAPSIYGSASAFLAAKQLGHSVEVSQRRYAGQLRGIPRTARTLDEAMQIESELDAVLASIGTRPAEGAPKARVRFGRGGRS